MLSVNGAVITDQNAASNYVRFLHPRQWALLNFDAIYAADWRHPDDQIAFWRHKAQKCAEILVPHVVDYEFVTGAYVVDVESAGCLADVGFDLPIAADPVLFFR